MNIKDNICHEVSYKVESLEIPVYIIGGVVLLLMILIFAIMRSRMETTSRILAYKKVDR